jgi:ABC-type transport system involved in cytochrome bd biosynthesis fused ATPase/permease subunit
MISIIRADPGQPRNATLRGGWNAGSESFRLSLRLCSPGSCRVTTMTRPNAASAAERNRNDIMSLIHARNIGIVSPRALFQNLDLRINEADRIGLIGSNGTGKTTLLRCLAGQAEPGTGDITRRRGLRVGFVEQTVPANLIDLPLSEAVRRALPAAERERSAWQVGQVLDRLDTPVAMRSQRLGTPLLCTANSGKKRVN